VKRIICVGNSLLAADAAGPAVHARLAATPLPEGVALCDGGLAGLDLLREVDGAERIVFVDTVTGFAGPGEVVSVDRETAVLRTAPTYDHGAGLVYLLRLLPALLGPALPPIHLVGVELPAGEAAFEEAARRALELCGTAAAGGAP
jgi:hydrogenase maturation protease